MVLYKCYIDAHEKYEQIISKASVRKI